MIRESAYDSLERVSKIDNRLERKEALRTLVQGIPELAKFLQYVHHPDVEWELPEGRIPFVASGDDQWGVFYNNIKKLPNYFKGSGVNPKQKVLLFMTLLESVTGKDAELLMSAKNKQLPWRKLKPLFVRQSLPELFPPVAEGEVETDKDD